MDLKVYHLSFQTTMWPSDASKSECQLEQMYDWKQIERMLLKNGWATGDRKKLHKYKHKNKFWNKTVRICASEGPLFYKNLVERENRTFNSRGAYAARDKIALRTALRFLVNLLVVFSLNLS